MDKRATKFVETRRLRANGALTEMITQATGDPAAEHYVLLAREAINKAAVRVDTIVRERG